MKFNSKNLQMANLSFAPSKYLSTKNAVLFRTKIKKYFKFNPLKP